MSALSACSGVIQPPGASPSCARIASVASAISARSSASGRMPGFSELVRPCPMISSCLRLPSAVMTCGCVS